MSRVLTRVLLCCAWVAAAAAVALGLAVFGAWLRVVPPPGHWSVVWPVEIGRWRGGVEVSVPKLLHAVTDPRLARWLDGRRVASPIGPLALSWDGASLGARCAPCVVHIAALGDEPVRLAAVTLTLQRAGEGRYAGHVNSGGVVLPWSADVTARSMKLRAELPPTPLASLVALLGDAVPEARRARIGGTVATRVSLEAPQRRWSVDSLVVEGFEVHGLGTEALVHAQPPAACTALPRGRDMRWLERAVIAAEDQRFAEHPGYDTAELRDAIAGRRRDERTVRGASTITQQLARLLYTGDERSLSRKVRELLVAVEMERTLGKGRILRLYLNLAPWGDGVCGAEAAARHYFGGKSAASLDPLEAAWLAARLRAPGAPVEPIEHRRMAQIVAQMRPMSPALREIWLEALPAWRPAAALP